MIKKIILAVFVLLILVFVGLQFFRPDRTNPPIDLSQTIEATVEIPEDVKLVLARSCKDCHSNETVYPWYSNVSPVSWFLADHIEHGRSHLNLSVWNTYDATKKAHKFEEICDMVKSGQMPLPSYLWIHRDAALSTADVQLLCDWTAAQKNR